MCLSKLRQSQHPMVDKLLELCWTSWRNAEEERRLKEIEEQNLYRYRAKTHVIGDEEGGGALEELLGSAIVDYSGFMEDGEEGETEGEGEGETEGGVEDTDTDMAHGVIGFSVDEMQCIAGLHMSLYSDRDLCSVSSASVQSAAKTSYRLACDVARLLLDDIPGVRHYT